MLTGSNILIISSKSSQYGGVEFHVLDLVKAFSRANTVWVMCPIGPLVELYEKSGATVLIKTPKNPHDFGFAKYVKKFCKQNSIMVVHAHELISAQGLFGAFLAKTPKRIWHVHTPFLQWKHPSFISKIIKHTLNWATNFVVANVFATDVIALTTEIAAHRKHSEWVLPNKVKVIPNAINTESFSTLPSIEDLDYVRKKYNIPKNKLIIGNLSRTSAEKGQELLLKAFNKINTKYPNTYFLLIAGGGELENRYKDYAQGHFPNSFCITGLFDEKDKSTLYHLMDYFIFPSYAEGFGYVLVEAMSCKLLVLASNIPVLQTVGGESVSYFKSGDEQDLYNKLCDLFLLPISEVARIKEQNLKKVDDYSFDAFIKNYSTVYRV